VLQASLVNIPTEQQSICLMDERRTLALEERAEFALFSGHRWCGLAILAASGVKIQTRKLDASRLAFV
jgi:hypothetical protein